MRRIFRQEELKILACLTMLIDHIGAVLFPELLTLRLIGRMAFPLYGFLLMQGVRYTSNRLNYGIRLALGMILAELPFDFTFYGGLTWYHQSVMVTLFLAYLMLVWMKHSNPVLPLVVCFVLAELAACDYGGLGIAMIWMFAVTEQEKWCWTTRIVGLFVIFSQIPSMKIPIADISVSIQLAAMIALIPMALYSGGKKSSSKWSQLLFYLFYPAHLAILYWVAMIL